GLIVQDVDAGTQALLHIGQGLNIPSGSEPAMQYDASTNTIIILQKYSSGDLKYLTIPIPSDPLDVKGYIVSKQKTLAIDSSVSLPLAPTFFYSKTRLHPQLGVMFVP